MRRSTILALSLLTASSGVPALFAQAPPPPPKVDKTGVAGPKSNAEAAAVKAVFEAQLKTPDDQIAAVEALLSKYADTVYKGFALELEAEAYQKKGDNNNTIVYAEQSLQADPNNYDADNLLANVIASRSKDTDLTRDEDLKKADKYAHDALTALDAGKPAIFARASDDAWAKTKAAATSQAWQAIGIIAMDRKKYDEAIADFQKGLDASPDTLLMIRMGRAYYTMRKYDDAIAMDQKVIDSPDAPPQYKKIATDDKQRFIQTKSTAK